MKVSYSPFKIYISQKRSLSVNIYIYIYIGNSKKFEFLFSCHVKTWFLRYMISFSLEKVQFLFHPIVILYRYLFPWMILQEFWNCIKYSFGIPLKYLLQIFLAQSAGAVEYIDWFSTDSPMSDLDMTLNNMMVRLWYLELWGSQTSPLLQSLPVPLKPGASTW